MPEKLKEQRLNVLCILTGVSGVGLLTAATFTLNDSMAPDAITWGLNGGAILMMLLCGMIAIIRKHGRY